MNHFKHQNILSKLSSNSDINFLSGLHCSMCAWHVYMLYDTYNFTYVNLTKSYKAGTITITTLQMRKWRPRGLNNRPKIMKQGQTEARPWVPKGGRGLSVPPWEHPATVRSSPHMPGVLGDRTESHWISQLPVQRWLSPPFFKEVKPWAQSH